MGSDAWASYPLALVEGLLPAVVAIRQAAAAAVPWVVEIVVGSSEPVGAFVDVAAVAIVVVAEVLVARLAAPVE